MLILLEAM